MIRYNKTLGFKVTLEYYQQFVRLAREKGLTVSQYFRLLLDDVLVKHSRENQLPLPAKALASADLESPSPSEIAYESPLDKYLAQSWLDIFKPYPEECNPDNYKDAGFKMAALIRKSRCLTLRAYAFQEGIDKFLRF
ncbi:MAG: hypothetical protein J0L83_13675 [Chitinophagales bacterium]|uniref:hypothetical protein n=1 Tax=Flavobacterium filum TaxID=370974 RepID=UPI001AD0BBD5|nr:hypothetical protein [Flavobacterium filum]MBN8665625.1 hypothetical protein [Chitinophagales bacterium]